MAADRVQNERDRRLGMWRELRRRRGPYDVQPSLVKELRLHRGQQGVFRDQELTASLTPTGTGVAVGVLHTGSTYADDLFDDGVIYHYPATARGERDRNEIASLKACADHTLPMFVVTTSSTGKDTRDVRLGWITDINDGAGQLLIAFSEEPLAATDPQSDDEEHPFELKVDRPLRSTTARARPGQGRFRFMVFKRYGTTCAFCSITVPKLLEAAHLCPVEDGGTDDPRNGLVMCLTHHKAFDAGLLLLNPDTFSVHPGLTTSDLQSIGVAVGTIGHLPRAPHRDALAWRWMRRGPGAVQEVAAQQHQVDGVSRRR